MPEQRDVAGEREELERDPADHEGRVGVQGANEGVAEGVEHPRGGDRHDPGGHEDGPGDRELTDARVVPHATNSFQGGDRINRGRVE